METLPADLAKVERRPCDRCPLAKRRGFLASLAGIGVYDYDTDCYGNGPRMITRGGYVEVDYVTGVVRPEWDFEPLCPVDITDDNRLREVSIEKEMYDRLEEACQEVASREANPAGLTSFERQMLSARHYVRGRRLAL